MTVICFVFHSFVYSYQMVYRLSFNVRVKIKASPDITDLDLVDTTL